MKGSICRRGNAWRITVSLGADAREKGQYRRYTETVRGTKSQAQARVHELLADLGKGAHLQPGSITMAALLKRWLVGYVKTHCSPRTQEGYASVVTNHLVPALGNVSLRKLDAQRINEYFANAKNAKTAEPLSPQTLHHHYRIMSEALKYAYRQGLITRNPCEMTDAPKARRKPLRVLTAEEVGVLLKEARGTDYYPVIFTAVNSGLRQGELLALRWRDVDVDEMFLTVSRSLYKRQGVSEFRQPKSDRSRRRVDLTPRLALFLREYRAEREGERQGLEKPVRPDDLVFQSAAFPGKPMDPGTLTHGFARIARRAGLEGCRFHDIRHTFASLMLLAGVNPKTVSEALGHASVAFTLDTYSHVLPTIQQTAMKRLDEVLAAAMPDETIFTSFSPIAQNRPREMNGASERI